MMKFFLMCTVFRVCIVTGGGTRYAMRGKMFENFVVCSFNRPSHQPSKKNPSQTPPKIQPSHGSQLSIATM